MLMSLFLFFFFCQKKKDEKWKTFYAHFLYQKKKSDTLKLFFFLWFRPRPCKCDISFIKARTDKRNVRNDEEKEIFFREALKLCKLPMTNETENKATVFFAMEAILLHDISPTLFRTNTLQHSKPVLFFEIFDWHTATYSERRKWRIMEVFSGAEIKRMFVENWNNLIYFYFFVLKFRLLILLKKERRNCNLNCFR